MTRQEFLHELQIALQGEMSREAVEGHVRYYGDYIMEESRKGASEEEVVARLGSPRLIAKTLIDTTEQFGPSFQGADGWGGDSRDEDSRRGFRAGYSQRGGWDVRLGKWKLNGWLGKLILCLLAGLALVVVANVVAFLLPILAPAILIVLICSIIFGNRR
jgi:hypothetical protein